MQFAKGRHSDQKADTSDEKAKKNQNSRPKMRKQNLSQRGTTKDDRQNRKK